jgi:hypothetical protein
VHAAVATRIAAVSPVASAAGGGRGDSVPLRRCPVMYVSTAAASFVVVGTRWWYWYQSISFGTGERPGTGGGYRLSCCWGATVAVRGLGCPLCDSNRVDLAVWDVYSDAQVCLVCLGGVAALG